MDFEGHRSYGVIEYGVVCLHSGTIESTFGRLCCATAGIPASDTEVHGLHRQDVSGEAPFAADYDSFVLWRSRGIFAAHHQQVEHGLLKHTWASPPFVPDWINQQRSIADWAPWLDTLRIMQQVYPALASHQLSGLIRDFDLQSELDQYAVRHCPPTRRKYHCALYDALASALLLLHLARQPGFEQMTITWLQELSLSAAQRNRRRQGELF
jgi:DNA polymerase III epsilon subunit-like protein